MAHGYFPSRFMADKCLWESVFEQKDDCSWKRHLCCPLLKKKWHLCPSAASNHFSTASGKWYMGHFPESYLTVSVMLNTGNHSSTRQWNQNRGGVGGGGWIFTLLFERRAHCLPALLPWHWCPHRWWTSMPCASSMDRLALEGELL